MSEALFEQVTTKEQISRLAALADEIWHEWFPEIISVRQIDYMLNRFQSVKAITDQLAKNHYEYYFITLDGEIIGYFGIQPQENNRLFLSKIYIRKDCRGKGLGSQTFERIKAICKERGFTSVWLTVNKHNDSSVAVYKKIGFKIIGEDITDIGNGFVMNDYFFELSID